jgi:hypothetical protein
MFLKFRKESEMTDEIIAKNEGLKKEKLCSMRNIFVVVFIICIVGAFSWYNYYTSFDTKRIGWTMAMLGKTRSDLNAYYDQKGGYPNTLEELAQFGENNPNSGIKPKLPKEYISQKIGCSLEHDSLNGKGGWYYDNAAGDIKVNVTTPIRNYFKLYFGEERNEIPSEW